LTILCTVVDCRRLDDAQFRIGAKFETKVTQTSTTVGGDDDDDDDDELTGVRRLFMRVRRWFAA
jgi:hypothetical protein